MSPKQCWQHSPRECILGLSDARSFMLAGPPATAGNKLLHHLTPSAGRGIPLIRSINGKTPNIHPSVFVSESAYIVGDVTIGENSSVWPGAVIRGDYGKIIIGKACSIQDNCVLHTDDYLELGDNVLMTHGAVVHGGVIGSNVLLGMNSAVLESARVGNYCLVGACALVLADSEIPDNSLVLGVPGRVRPLTEENMERLKDPTAVYVENARAYIEAGLGLQIPRPQA